MIAGERERWRLSLIKAAHNRFRHKIAPVKHPNAARRFSRTAAVALANSRKESVVSLDRGVLIFAGIMVLLSVLLAWTVSTYFLWFTVFIGLNMIQSAFTGFCPAAYVFRRLGVKSGAAF